MGKRKLTKQQKRKAVAERSQAEAATRQARADEYRTALGLPLGAKLPSSIGNTVSAGGGRNRRGKVVGNSKKTGAANVNRAKLIG
jgi:hypothetical protein